MNRPKLTAKDLARIDVLTVKQELRRLEAVVDALSYVPPEAADIWQTRLDQAAKHVAAIADGLRLTRRD